VTGLQSQIIRDIDPRHFVALREFVSSLHPDDVRLRFASYRRLEQNEELRAAFRCDGPAHEMVWAFTPGGTLAGIASCVLVSTSEWDLGLIIRSDLKRKKIGTWLLEQVKDYAHRRQIHTLSGLVLWENRPMVALARKAGFALVGEPSLLSGLRFELNR
jgi:RimJ/RimL family protein N-acetyltransferase